MTDSHHPETDELAKAVALRDSGQVTASLSLLHVVCDENPVNPTAWHQLGIGYVKAGKIGHAQQCLMRAADLDPHNIVIVSHLANIHVLRKDIDAAIEQAKKLVALNPASAKYHLFLASLYASSNKLGDALHCVHVAIDGAPEVAAAHVLLAQIELARRKPAMACAAVSRALQLEPGNMLAQQIRRQAEQLSDNESDN